jgi:hypothetical protein
VDGAAQDLVAADLGIADVMQAGGQRRHDCCRTECLLYAVLRQLSPTTDVNRPNPECNELTHNGLSWLRREDG